MERMKEVAAGFVAQAEPRAEIAAQSESRPHRRCVNRAVNRLLRERGAVSAAESCIGLALRMRANALGRELVPREVEDFCELLTFDDIIYFIRTDGALPQRLVARERFHAE